MTLGSVDNHMQVDAAEVNHSDSQAGQGCGAKITLASSSNEEQAEKTAEFPYTFKEHQALVQQQKKSQHVFELSF